MTIGSPIEEQCVRMWRIVFGNLEHSVDDARRAFWMQNPLIIDGWEKLAKHVNKVTTVATLEHVSKAEKMNAATEIMGEEIEALEFVREVRPADWQEHYSKSLKAHMKERPAWATEEKWRAWYFAPYIDIHGDPEWNPKIQTFNQHVTTARRLLAGEVP